MISHLTKINAIQVFYNYISCHYLRLFISSYNLIVIFAKCVCVCACIICALLTCYSQVLFCIQNQFPITCTRFPYQVIHCVRNAILPLPLGQYTLTSLALNSLNCLFGATNLNPLNHLHAWVLLYALLGPPPLAMLNVLLNGIQNVFNAFLIGNLNFHYFFMTIYI